MAKKKDKKSTNAEKFGMMVFWGFLGLIVAAVIAIVVSNLIEGNDYFDVMSAVNTQWFTMILLLEAFGIIYLVLTGFFKKEKKEKKVEQFYSNRWMKSEEINKVYDTCGKLSMLSNLKALGKGGGTLVRFAREGNEVNVNFNPRDDHTIVLGTTGSGKTQGYVLPYVWSLAQTGAKPNMIITDPKGEILSWTREELKSKGYEVAIFDLKEPTKSSRWNPLENVWNMFQRAHKIESELKVHYGENPADLKLKHIVAKYPHEWYSFNKIAFPSKEQAEQEMMAFKQKLISDAESELRDICSVIAPIENEKEPSWENGARDLIQATIIAMLEDSLVPELGMTKEKFNFYNVNRILSIRDDDGQNMYGTIKDYFKGRDPYSASIPLSNTVLTNAEITMRSFFGTVTGKMSLFNDKGVCYITSGTDMDFTTFVKKPTAFFLIIPDQIKVRWKLATLCVSMLYKKLVEIADSMGGSLKWPTNFILDEFGNMPKFENFSTVMNVSRGRKCFFSLIIQDYKQLETIYGPTEGITIRNACNTQIFIGVNDAESRKIFSEFCGEMAVDVENKSTNKAKDKDKGGDSTGTSTSKASRPLLPPNELLEMKPGLVYIYSFGRNPLKSTFTQFHTLERDGLLKIRRVSDDFAPMKFLPEAEIYYDITKRNSLILKDKRKNDIFDW